MRKIHHTELSFICARTLLSRVQHLSCLQQKMVPVLCFARPLPLSSSPLTWPAAPPAASAAADCCRDAGSGFVQQASCPTKSVGELVNSVTLPHYF